MKARIFWVSLVLLAGFWAGMSVGAAEETKASAKAVVVPEQYLALSNLLTKNRGDLEKCVEITKKSVLMVVSKGGTQLEKRRLLGEIATTFMATVKDWKQEERIAIAKAIALATLEITEEIIPRDLYIRQVFGAMAFATTDTVAIRAAIGALPKALQAEATEAVHEPMVILGGKVAWDYRDLYDAVRDALKANPDELRPGDVIITLVSTTTTTSTSTSTTTTTIPGTGKSRFVDKDAEIEVIPVIPPVVVPTTKPSPTPVGLR